MDNRKETNERRKRRTVSRPVLVRSERPGQVMSANYVRQRTELPFWKAA